MNKRLLTFNSYFILLMMGLAKNIIGPTLPDIIEKYDITLTIAGILFTLLSLGRLLAVIGTSAWLDSIGLRPVLIIGSLSLTTGLFSYTISNWWWLHLLAIMAIGFGIGLIGSGANVLIVLLYKKNKGNALSRLHMFFGIGALLAPLIAGSLLSLGFSWRIVYASISILSLILFIFILTRNYPSIREDKDVNKTKNMTNIKDRLIKILSSPVYYILAIAVFIYVGVGNGIIGWVNKYLSDSLAFTALAASIVLALYNGGITIGRMGFSFITETLGYKKSILLCSSGTLLSISMATLSSSPILIIIGFALTGLFLAGVFPITIAYGSHLFPEMVGTVSSSLIASASLGGTLIPLLIGIVSDHYGLQGGMYITIFFATIFFIISLVLLNIDDNSNN